MIHKERVVWVLVRGEGNKLTEKGVTLLWRLFDNISQISIILYNHWFILQIYSLKTCIGRFKAALFTTANNCKHPKCSLTDQCLNQFCYICVRNVVSKIMKQVSTYWFVLYSRCMENRQVTEVTYSVMPLEEEDRQVVGEIVKWQLMIDKW